MTCPNFFGHQIQQPWSLMKKRTKKQYTQEYKETCVARAIKIGNISACSREVGLSYGVLLSWIKNPKINRGIKSMSLKDNKDESLELQELKRINARLKEENDILKKATAYFSQKELKKGTRS